MTKPTYTKEEILSLIQGAELSELESVREVMKEESKRYPLTVLKEIVAAYKGRINALYKRNH
ncbi:MAG: hypothetical protein HRU40_21585 [Saprospiraceae bacterium]|nr:hypothetical protein [Saprospiraceae bacterium]